jgi:hypothetical protein
MRRDDLLRAPLAIGQDQLQGLQPSRARRAIDERAGLGDVESREAKAEHGEIVRDRLGRAGRLQPIEIEGLPEQLAVCALVHHSSPDVARAFPGTELTRATRGEVQHADQPLVGTPGDGDQDSVPARERAGIEKEGRGIGEMDR